MPSITVELTDAQLEGAKYGVNAYPPHAWQHAVGVAAKAYVPPSIPWKPGLVVLAQNTSRYLCAEKMGQPVLVNITSGYVFSDDCGFAEGGFPPEIWKVAP